MACRLMMPQLKVRSSLLCSYWLWCISSTNAAHAGLLDGLLMTATVDGGVYAADSATGQGKWSQMLSAHVSAMHLVPRPGDRPLNVPFVDIATNVRDPTACTLVPTLPANRRPWLACR